MIPPGTLEDGTQFLFSKQKAQRDSLFPSLMRSLELLGKPSVPVCSAKLEQKFKFIYNCPRALPFSGIEVGCND